MPSFRSVLLAITLASVAAPIESYGQDAAAPSPIVGTWLLESIVDTLAGADPFRTLGAAELRDVVGGYYAYFGRYQVTPP